MDKKEYIDINLIKAFMALKGIDEKELARLMDVSLIKVKRLLGGADQRRMGCSLLYKLAIAFGVKAQSLLHKEYR